MIGRVAAKLARLPVGLHAARVPVRGRDVGGAAQVRRRRRSGRSRPFTDAIDLRVRVRARPGARERAQRRAWRSSTTAARPRRRSRRAIAPGGLVVGAVSARCGGRSASTSCSTRCRWCCERSRRRGSSSRARGRCATSSTRRPSGSGLDVEWLPVHAAARALPQRARRLRAVVELGGVPDRPARGDGVRRPAGGQRRRRHRASRSCRRPASASRRASRKRSPRRSSSCSQDPERRARDERGVDATPRRALHRRPPGRGHRRGLRRLAARPVAARRRAARRARASCTSRRAAATNGSVSAASSIPSRRPGGRPSGVVGVGVHAVHEPVAQQLEREPLRAPGRSGRSTRCAVIEHSAPLLDERAQPHAAGRGTIGARSGCASSTR